MTDTSSRALIAVEFVAGVIVMAIGYVELVYEWFGFYDFVDIALVGVGAGLVGFLGDRDATERSRAPIHRLD